MKLSEGAMASEKYCSAFPLIDRDSYMPHTFPYILRKILEDRQLPTSPSLEEWLKIFYDSVSYFSSMAGQDPSLTDETERERVAETFKTQYISSLDALKSRVEASMEEYSKVQEEGLLTCMHLCQLREEALRRAGCRDAFVKIKENENMKSLDILPDVCSELDSIHDHDELWETVIKNACAANIFDLGSAHTTKMFHVRRFCF